MVESSDSEVWWKKDYIDALWTRYAVLGGKSVDWVSIIKDSIYHIGICRSSLRAVWRNPDFSAYYDIFTNLTSEEVYDIAHELNKRYGVVVKEDEIPVALFQMS